MLHGGASRERTKKQIDNVCICLDVFKMQRLNYMQRHNNLILILQGCGILQNGITENSIRRTEMLLEGLVIIV